MLYVEALRDQTLKPVLPHVATQRVAAIEVAGAVAGHLARRAG
jgi:hypothetical protein